MNEARQREQQKKAKKRTRQGTTHETDLKTSQKGKNNKQKKNLQIPSLASNVLVP